jgi:hypothetical protein
VLKVLDKQFTGNCRVILTARRGLVSLLEGASAMKKMMKFVVASADETLYLKSADLDVRIRPADDGFASKEEIVSTFQRFEGKYLGLEWPLAKTENCYIRYAVDFLATDFEGVERAILQPLKISKLEVVAR